MSKVTAKQAEQVRAEVARVFLAEAVGSEPSLMTDFDGRAFTIVWEEGPYEWPFRFPDGGFDEEMTGMLQEFKPGAVAETATASLPDGVWTEAINHYSIAVYPEGVGMTTRRCAYDSGSMTDCQPLCAANATQVVTYRNGSSGPFDVEVCDRHVAPMKGRAYPGLESVRPIGGTS